MKTKNMSQLVDDLERFIKTSDFLYHPLNLQYSFYIDIFLDENSNGNRMPIDKFSDELVRKLISDKNIQQLDPNYSSYCKDSQEVKNYIIFHNTWSAWDLLYARVTP
ncbi:MAG: hypothetical protein K2X39_04955 [Silvanigrellaceae bacterium]|nr:hypothetical protein [Silvanigrellaceae bacterium]